MQRKSSGPAIHWFENKDRTITPDYQVIIDTAECVIAMEKVLNYLLIRYTPPKARGLRNCVIEMKESAAKLRKIFE